MENRHSEEPAAFRTSLGAYEDGYYLAEFVESRLVSVDGPHAEPAGVARAMKLYRALGFSNREPARTYRMIRVEAVPDLDPPINDEAAGICRNLLDGVTGGKG